MFIFSLLATFVTLTFFYISDKEKFLMIYELINNGVANITQSKNRPLMLLFYKTTALFVFLNLFFNMFSINGFIYSSEHVPFFLVFVFGFTLFSITFSLITSGVKRTLENLYYKIGEETWFIPISITISLIKILTGFIIKPFSLFLRLYMLTMIGNTIHSTFAHNYLGIPILIFVGLAKLVVYVIQVYIILDGLSSIFNSIVCSKE